MNPNTNSGFYETLVIPTNNIQNTARVLNNNDYTFCSQLLSVKKKMGKNNSIPSQFPNLTKIIAPNKNS
jgi:hypothetical protein